MSWTVTVIENTAVVHEDADKLNAFVRSTLPHREFYGDPVASDGSPSFDPDDMEHIDWLTSNDDLCKLFAAFGATGRVTFGTLDGDNKGEFWGVEFQSGHYRRLHSDIHKLQWNVGTSYPGYRVDLS